MYLHTLGSHQSSLTTSADSETDWHGKAMIRLGFDKNNFQGSLIEARLVLLNTIVNTSSARDLYTQAQKQFQHVERNTFRKKHF